MSIGGSFVAKAQAEAELLGHEIVWDEVGDHLAHGHCAKCGMTVTAASPDGVTQVLGDAPTNPCPKASPSA